MKRIRWAGLKLPLQVPLPSYFILDMHKQRSDTCYVSRLRSAQQRVSEQCFPQPRPLMLNIHSQPGQDHDRHRVLWNAFDHSGRCCCGVDTANGKAVKPNHRPAVATHIGPANRAGIKGNDLAKNRIRNAGRKANRAAKARFH